MASFTVKIVSEHVMTLPCRLLMIKFQVLFMENVNNKMINLNCNYLSSDAVPSFQLPTIYITERVGIIVTKFERTRLDFRKSPSSYLIWLSACSDTSRLTKLAPLALYWEKMKLVRSSCGKSLIGRDMSQFLRDVLILVTHCSRIVRSLIVSQERFR